MDNKTYWDYFLVFTPILVGHVIVPPLSYFQVIGGEKPLPIFDFIYSTVPDFLLDSSFVHTMLFDDDARKRTNEQWITCIFVHGSYHHMINNLAAALDFGYRVYTEFGSIGLYSCFLCGGVFANIPSSLYQSQKQTFTNEFQKLFSSYGEPFIPSMLSKYWNNLSRKVAEISTKTLLPTKSCGSSGAVCALMGCNLLFSIRDVAMVIYEIISTTFYSIENNYNNNRNNNTTNSLFQQKKEKLYNIFQRILTNHRAIYKTFQIIHIVSYLNDEFNHIYNYSNFSSTPCISVPKGSIGSGGVSNNGKGTFLELLQSRLIGHSAHVQGIVFGFAFGTVFGIIIPSVQRTYIQYNNRRR